MASLTDITFSRGILTYILGGSSAFLVVVVMLLIGLISEKVETLFVPAGSAGVLDISGERLASSLLNENWSFSSLLIIISFYS